MDQVTDEAGGRVVGGKEGKKMGAGCVETGIESTIGGTAERDAQGDVDRRGTETDDCMEKDGQEDRAEAWACWWQRAEGLSCQPATAKNGAPHPQLTR